MYRLYTYIIENSTYAYISQFMGYMKGKSALMIIDNYDNLKYKYVQRNFWAKGYCASTVD